MLEQKDINKIKEAVEEFFEKMTLEVSNIKISLSFVNPARKPEQSRTSKLSEEDLSQKHSNNPFLNVFKKEISKEGLLNGVKKDSQDAMPTGKQAQNQIEEKIDVVELDIKLNEPQILIGQQGQTLFEIQRLLRTVLSRKLQKFFYLNLDINDYKKKKTEYLKDLIVMQTGINQNGS